MLLKVTHCTTYLYPGGARDSHNEVRLMPLNDETQSCLSAEILVTPYAKVSSFTSKAGMVSSFNLRENHASLEITLRARVHTLISDPFSRIQDQSMGWEGYDPDAMMSRHAERLTESSYVRLSPAAKELSDEIRRESGDTPLSFLLAVKERLHKLLAYDTDVTHVHTNSDEVLEIKQGVCQDFAHVMLALVRVQGIPCRYVSGYIFNDVDESLRGNQAMHAWVDCLLPDGNWLGVDPTNNILANDHHIRVHVGADYSEVTPTKGIYWGFVSEPPKVSVHIERLPEGMSQSMGSMIQAMG